ncbi:hypothetical protein GGR50DRAFT_303100 [Xylaria sp. CBS 124048]|nr:hypothetical protein GGR50DRAFT_303100 [Xylaria sp. CBS 124048]
MMRHTTCLLSPARVLHRVLLLELGNATSRSNAIISSRPHLRHAQALGQAVCPAPCCHARAFSRTAHLSQETDENIPYRWVIVPDAEGRLSQPRRLEHVLATLSEHESLVMVAPPPPTQVASGPNPPMVRAPPAAICRIIDLKAQMEKAKQTAKEAELLGKITKQLEISWVIAANDLSHKMKRLKEFLEKGLRVEVMLARKKGSTPATTEQCEEVIQHIRGVFDSVPGATEFKKMDGKMGMAVKLSLVGPEKTKKGKKAGRETTPAEKRRNTTVKGSPRAAPEEAKTSASRNVIAETSRANPSERSTLAVNRVAAQKSTPAADSNTFTRDFKDASPEIRTPVGPGEVKTLAFNNIVPEKSTPPPSFDAFAHAFKNALFPERSTQAATSEGRIPASKDFIAKPTQAEPSEARPLATPAVPSNAFTSDLKNTFAEIRNAATPRQDTEKSTQAKPTEANGSSAKKVPDAPKPADNSWDRFRFRFPSRSGPTFR